MEQHVQAAVFTPRSARNRDASITSSEDSASHNSCSPHRKGSVTAYPSSQTSSLKSHLRRGQTMPVNNISLNTRVKPAWSVFTSPGTFEQLYNERAYLNASLRGQGERSFELMRRLTVLHEQMDSFLPSDERRRSRKKAALIKSKNTEAAAQEKAISIRLCDINAELSIRERWMQVQHEIYEQRYCYWAMESPVTGYMASPTDLASVVSTPLDAASPVFFPVGYYPIYSPMQMMPCHEPEATPPEMWAKMNETPIDALGNHGLQFCYDNPQSLARNADEASSELPGADIVNKRGRRMSLPSLRCLWPGQQDD
ncbi:hypothetical protein CcaCcLH18_03929 [Colletotrichum camelliae]|nr:hypothetical protein CcaCcLH18_03929 [Colletotrichum camelliae]